MQEPKELNMEVIVSEEDLAVYVKFTGFDDDEDADTWADKMVNELPLLLFQSNIKH